MKYQSFKRYPHLLTQNTAKTHINIGVHEMLWLVIWEKLFISITEKKKRPLFDTWLAIVKIPYQKRAV